MLKDPTPLDTAVKATRDSRVSAFGISVFINLALFAVPLYSLQVFDRVLSSRNLGTLVMLTLIVGVFLLLYGVLEHVRSGILVRGGNRFHASVARPLFEVAMRAHLNGRPAAALQALKDADTIREVLSGKALSNLFDVPWTPIFVGICFLFHPAMGAVALVGAILIFACALLTELFTKSELLRAGKEAGDASRYSESSLRNAEVIKGLGMGSAVLARWEAMQAAMLLAQSASSEKASILLAATKVVRMGVQIALIGVGAWLAIDRLISPGVMMASMILMGRALAPVEQVVGNWRRLIAARAAYQRLNELFGSLVEPVEPIALPEANGHLSVENLVIRAPATGATILKDVTFSVQAGASVAIVGPSGGGKSSLVRALAGIWRPTLGSVRLDGAALAHWNSAQLAGAIGYLPQDVEFFSGTVAENIARLGIPNDEAVIVAAKAAGVHEAVLRLPKGYQTALGDGQVVLSGGMRQRVALARALYGKPRLVIMDEPNASLDTDGEMALRKTMAQLKADQCTVVVVTHRPQLLAHVDYVLVIKEGRKSSFGPRAEILARSEKPNVSLLNASKATASIKSTRELGVSLETPAA